MTFKRSSTNLENSDLVSPRVVCRLEAPSRTKALTGTHLLSVEIYKTTFKGRLQTTHWHPSISPTYLSGLYFQQAHTHFWLNFFLDLAVSWHCKGVYLCPDIESHLVIGPFWVGVWVSADRYDSGLRPADNLLSLVSYHCIHCNSNGTILITESTD